MGRLFRAGVPLLFLFVFCIAGCHVPEPAPSPTATTPSGSDEDAYEADNTTNTAKTITNGQSQSRTLHSLTDIDWIKFTVDDTVPFYTFTATSGSDVLNLAIYSADNLSVAIFEGTANDPCINEITTTGTYYLKVTSFNGQKGSYTLLFKKDDPTTSIRRKPGLLK